MEAIKWYEDSEIKCLNDDYYEVPYYLYMLCESKKICFYGRERTAQTKLIKNLLVLLAVKHGYRVYTNQLDQWHCDDIAEELKLEKIKDFKVMKSKEWLFDIHWYLELNDDKKNLKASKDKLVHERYRPTEFPLAVECEWDENVKEVKYDFQKLLFCNADKRVLIYKTKATDKDELAASSLSEYFVNAINSYPKEKCIDTKFLFAAFCVDSKKTILGTYDKQK